VIYWSRRPLMRTLCRCGTVLGKRLTFDFFS
jgi:hypothetical protein